MRELLGMVHPANAASASEYADPFVPLDNTTRLTNPELEQYLGPAKFAAALGDPTFPVVAVLRRDVHTGQREVKRLKRLIDDWIVARAERALSDYRLWIGEVPAAPAPAKRSWFR